MTRSEEPVLELRALYKRFGDTVAVAGVSAALERGEYVCLLGPSGCGKTTLLRLIAGFEEPTDGDVLLEGRSLDGVPPERRDVNVVFQSYALFPHLSVRENVAFGPRMRRLSASDVESRVTEALRLVRLAELSERMPRQLSGGQQQRVALARALVNRPKVLLLDEPLSALDRSLRVTVQEELKALQRETGVTFVHVTHDQGEALSLADRVVLMRAGAIEQVGSPREVYERPRNRFVAEFMGAANLFEGTLVSPVEARTDGGLSILLSAPARGTGRVLLSVRPETIVLAPAPDGVSSDVQLQRAGLLGRAHAEGRNELEGFIESLGFAGPLTDCRVSVQGHSLRVVLPASAVTRGLAQGVRVAVHIPRAAVAVLEAEHERSR